MPKNNLKNKKGEIIIYKTQGGPEIQVKLEQDSIWLDAHLIASVFSVNRPAIVKHINNIYKTGELNEISTCSKMEQVAADGKVRKMNLYNLDMIISVGYRVNSKKATQFRIWATKILREHITKGFTLNPKVIKNNYTAFQKAVSNIKQLLPVNTKIDNASILELVAIFADTWLSLAAYDKAKLPAKGSTKKSVRITALELGQVLSGLKKELMSKKEATELFGQMRNNDALAGIVGTVFQSVGGKDAYQTLEDKSAHLLYFMVKNHPFVDGNKRSGAFAFVWFLQKARLLNTVRLNPEALTALTLLVAESRPTDKEKIIGVILMLLK